MSEFSDRDEWPDDVLLDNLEAQYELDSINGDMMWELLNRWQSRAEAAETERDRLNAGIAEVRQATDALNAGGPGEAFEALREREDAIDRLIDLSEKGQR